MAKLLQHPRCSRNLDRMESNRVSQRLNTHSVIIERERDGDLFAKQLIFVFYSQMAHH